VAKYAVSYIINYPDVSVATVTIIRYLHKNNVLPKMQLLMYYSDSLYISHDTFIFITCCISATYSNLFLCVCVKSMLENRCK